MNPNTIETSLGRAELHDIFVFERSVPNELMGEVDLGGMLCLLVKSQLPDASERRLVNAVLVALADHGLTPMAIATRLTHTGAPDSIQGAIASGLLGAGSAYLGVFEDVGKMLAGRANFQPADVGGVEEAAERIVAEHLESGRPIPGIGHPIHKKGDPRTERLYSLAEEEARVGPHMRLMRGIQDNMSRRKGRTVPLNATGACGALLLDLGYDSRILRGFAVVARAAGLVGHLQEELNKPAGTAIWNLVERESRYAAVFESGADSQ